MPLVVRTKPRVARMNLRQERLYTCARLPVKTAMKCFIEQPRLRPPALSDWKSQGDMRHAGSAESVQGVLRMRSPDPTYELGLCPRSGDVKEREPMHELGV